MGNDVEKLTKHIDDKDARDLAEYYARQFARLHQFPTCLGNAIEAYDKARELDPDDRQTLELFFSSLSKYVGAENEDDKYKNEFISYAKNLRKGNKKYISFVIDKLGGGIPKPSRAYCKSSPINF